jgi:hypothetical protein
MSKKNKPAEKEPAPPAGLQGIDYAASAARVLLGGVFLVSGLHKTAAPPEEFAVVIEAYHLVSAATAAFMSITLPWAEILLGLMLVTGFKARKASAAGGAFFLMFIFAIGSTIVRGVPLENCGCFGSAIHLTPPQALGLDSLLLCLSYFAYKRGAGLAPADCWIEKGR